MKEMNEEKFTDDNEFNELKKLLKDLPKVNAPDNFEFNLMTRIQNKNFEVKSEKKKSWFSWSLTPAIAFAASVFLIFFLFSGGEDESNDNPWNTLPQLMEENIAEADNPKIDKEEVDKLSANNEITKTNTPPNLAASNNAKKDYPFEKESSINFDEYLQSDAQKPAEVGAQLAGSQDAKTSPFDGFFLRKRKDVQKRDSIKKDNDSLQQQEIDKTYK
ncbi:MAG: hypothetical protein L3J41_00805 [Melioribacteraceae bacterium]|nr:hypothetical protein [Melioribacteraceae bacterium]